MKKIAKTTVGTCVIGLILLAAGWVWAADLIISIEVAPKTLNLNNSGQVVTIHTDLSYGSVVAQSVYLNDVLIQSWKADNRGNFVAKFNIDTIKNLPGLIIGSYNTLTLTGATIDGNSFSGSADIMVIAR